MRTFFSLLLLLTAAGLQAQILNVEKVRVDTDSSNYFLGTVRFNLTMNNRGSTDDRAVRFIGLTSNADVAYISGRHSYKFMNFLEYISTNDNAFINTGYTHFRINFNRRQKVSTETFVQYQFDEPRGLKRRMLGGGGLRIRLIQKDNFNLYFGPGIMYEHEEWRHPSDTIGIITKGLIKSTNYISTRIKMSGHASLNSIAYYQVGYDGEDNVYRHRWSAEVNLRLKITARLNFITTFSGTYENRPIIPIQRYVYVLTNGLIVDF